MEKFQELLCGNIEVIKGNIGGYSVRKYWIINFLVRKILFVNSSSNFIQSFSSYIKIILRRSNCGTSIRASRLHRVCVSYNCAGSVFLDERFLEDSSRNDIEWFPVFSLICRVCRDLIIKKLFLRVGTVLFNRKMWIGNYWFRAFAAHYVLRVYHQTNNKVIWFV